MSEEPEVVSEQEPVRAKLNFWLWFEVVTKLLIVIILIGVVWVTVSQFYSQESGTDKSVPTNSLEVKKGRLTK